MLACDFYPSSFCESVQLLPNDEVFYGIISSKNEDGIGLEIIEVLNGEEVNPEVNIWNGTDINCNGPFSMASTDFGELGDTIICIAERIIEAQNTWDVIGEFRRPSQLTYSTFLRSINGLVWDPDFQDQISLQEYLNFWETAPCNIKLSNQEIDLQIFTIAPNPAFNHISIIGSIATWKSYSVYSINGQVVGENIPINDSSKIELYFLKSGLYLFKLEDQDGNVYTKKVMVNR